MANSQAGSNGKYLPTIGQEAGPSIDQNGRPSFYLRDRTAARGRQQQTLQQAQPNQSSVANDQASSLGKDKAPNLSAGQPLNRTDWETLSDDTSQSDGTINRTRNESNCTQQREYNADIPAVLHQPSTSLWAPWLGSLFLQNETQQQLPSGKCYHCQGAGNLCPNIPKTDRVTVKPIKCKQQPPQWPPGAYSLHLAPHAIRSGILSSKGG
jgi:hypothetical protein